MEGGKAGRKDEREGWREGRKEGREKKERGGNEGRMKDRIMEGGKKEGLREGGSKGREREGRKEGRMKDRRMEGGKKEGMREGRQRKTKLQDFGSHVSFIIVLIMQKHHIEPVCHRNNQLVCSERLLHISAPRDIPAHRPLSLWKRRYYIRGSQK